MTMRPTTCLLSSCASAFLLVVACSSSDSKGPDGSATPDAASCDQLAAAARAQYQSALGSTAPLACQLDSDCTFFYLPLAQYCFTTCGDAVAEADVSALEAATASICDPYRAAGCPAVPVPPCIPQMAVCDRGQCAAGWPESPDDAAADSSDGGNADGVVSGTDGASGSDGGASLDSGVLSKCSACGSSELCIGYYDGLCTPLGVHCVEVSAATREGILVKHERCFMRPIGDEICGNRDGGVFWGCGGPPCLSEPLVSDINCYGP